MIACGMEPEREQVADRQIKLRTQQPMPEVEIKKPLHPKCVRCGLLRVGLVSHETADDCLILVISRMKMRSSLVDTARKQAYAATETAKNWKLKAETANKLLRESQAKEGRLLNQVVALDAALKAATERAQSTEASLRQKVQELAGRAETAEAELRRKARALDTVARRVDRLSVDIVGRVNNEYAR